MASHLLASEINRTLWNKILFAVAAICLLSWIFISEQYGWMFFVFDSVPGKLFLFFVFSFNIFLLGVIAYAYFYIPPLKGFLVRLHGSFIALAVLSVGGATWGIPDLRRIEFTTSRVFVDFYQPADPVAFISLASICVIGLCITGFFYIVADLIDRLP